MSPSWIKGVPFGRKGCPFFALQIIEPYDFKDAVPFQTPYFAGYVADRYDVNMEECILS